ncbi:hypothetical protein BOSEA1005_30209 [Hyphomicrobiales bacterium]|nr:hypothetical protein BOSEA1005_30209 [Hyphomicrobiales bacterium]
MEAAVPVVSNPASLAGFFYVDPNEGLSYRATDGTRRASRSDRGRSARRDCCSPRGAARTRRGRPARGRDPRAGNRAS